MGQQYTGSTGYIVPLSNQSVIVRPPWRMPQEEVILDSGNLTVLVVDDEPNIVEVVSAYLKRELIQRGHSLGWRAGAEAGGRG